MNQEVQMKLLYQQEQLPIFQNRMYDTEAEANACPKGDMKKSIVGQLRRSFFSHDQKSAALATFDESINLSIFLFIHSSELI
jgi:hypothetical protein